MGEAINLEKNNIHPILEMLEECREYICSTEENPRLLHFPYKHYEHEFSEIRSKLRRDRTNNKIEDSEFNIIINSLHNDSDISISILNLACDIYLKSQIYLENLIDGLLTFYAKYIEFFIHQEKYSCDSSYFQHRFQDNSTRQLYTNLTVLIIQHLDTDDVRIIYRNGLTELHNGNQKILQSLFLQLSNLTNMIINYKKDLEYLAENYLVYKSRLASTAQPSNELLNFLYTTPGSDLFNIFISSEWEDKLQNQFEDKLCEIFAINCLTLIKASKVIDIKKWRKVKEIYQTATPSERGGALKQYLDFEPSFITFWTEERMKQFGVLDQQVDRQQNYLREELQNLNLYLSKSRIYVLSPMRCHEQKTKLDYVKSRTLFNSSHTPSSKNNSRPSSPLPSTQVENIKEQLKPVEENLVTTQRRKSLFISETEQAALNEVSLKIREIRVKLMFPAQKQNLSPVKRTTEIGSPPLRQRK